MDTNTKPLMFDALAQEHLLAHQPRTDAERYEHRIDLLRRTLMGFATNATNCKACAMGNECATEALARDDLLAEGGA